MGIRTMNVSIHGTPEVLTAEEFNAIAHLRGHCHYGPECPICRIETASYAAVERAKVSRIGTYDEAYRRGYDTAVDMVASGHP